MIMNENRERNMPLLQIPIEDVNYITFIIFNFRRLIFFNISQITVMRCNEINELFRPRGSISKSINTTWT